MSKNILFLQGGAGEEDHAADAQLVASLQKELGESYAIQYPLLPEEQVPDFGRKKQIAAALSSIDIEVIVAHSLGASMLLKYLSEGAEAKGLKGIFLIATPFWSGNEDWKQGLKLEEDFAAKLPKNLPIFLYHSKDDKEVPVEHLEQYAQQLPKATVRKIASGGHQLDNDLSLVAKDIVLL